MLELDVFVCIAFEHRVGQLYIICAWRYLFYSAILFTSKFTDHMIAAKYDDISGIFKRGKFS